MQTIFESVKKSDGSALNTTKVVEGDKSKTVKTYSNGAIEETITKNGLTISKVVTYKDNTQWFIFYDETGNAIKSVLPNGSSIIYNYNDDEVTGTYYDPEGNVIHENVIGF